MCPTKMLLKSSVDSNNPYISTYLLFKILLKEQRRFSKICCVHGPLGCYCPVQISKKSLFGVII